VSELLQRWREILNLRDRIRPSSRRRMVDGRRIRERRRHRQLTWWWTLLRGVVERASSVRLLLLLQLLLLVLLLLLLLLMMQLLLILLLLLLLALYPPRGVGRLSGGDVGEVIRIRRDLSCSLSCLLSLDSVPLLLREVLVVRLGVLVRASRAALRCRRESAVRSFRVGLGRGGDGGSGGGGAAFEVGRRDEGLEERVAEDEGVEAGLLRGPSSFGVEVEETLHKVDERDSILHLYGPTPHESVYQRREEKLDAPFSTSASLSPFLTIGYCLMISGSVAAVKYFLLGCSWSLNSAE
jgi:hypothetical protein